ncbi:MAG: hypothetical protein K940chlam3_00744 [Chlamydiae bacterium]|nr:hypothetical protein [Chlamydiota bacterium]
MEVTYRAIVPQSDENCGICLSPLNEEGPVIAHTGVLIHLLHPMHKACLEEWFKQKLICPICRAPVKIALKERLIRVIRPELTLWRFFQFVCLCNILNMMYAIVYPSNHRI